MILRHNQKLQSIRIADWFPPKDYCTPLEVCCFTRNNITLLIRILHREQDHRMPPNRRALKRLCMLTLALLSIMLPSTDGLTGAAASHPVARASKGGADAKSVAVSGGGEED